MSSSSNNHAPHSPEAIQRCPEQRVMSPSAQQQRPFVLPNTARPVSARAIDVHATPQQSDSRQSAIRELLSEPRSSRRRNDNMTGDIAERLTRHATDPPPQYSPTPPPTSLPTLQRYLSSPTHAHSRAGLRRAALARWEEQSRPSSPQERRHIGRRRRTTSEIHERLNTVQRLMNRESDFSRGSFSTTSPTRPRGSPRLTVTSPRDEAHLSLFPARTSSLLSPSSASTASLAPRWQPDSEVNACPICGRAFSFFYRKHHCRKCGRVVCANCSPHRITIPKQYIVRPPEEIDTENETGERDPAVGDALGGGEEVRLCNPCVPDPNPAPPPGYPFFLAQEGIGAPQTSQFGQLNRLVQSSDRFREARLSHGIDSVQTSLANVQISGVESTDPATGLSSIIQNSGSTDTQVIRSSQPPSWWRVPPQSVHNSTETTFREHRPHPGSLEIAVSTQDNARAPRPERRVVQEEDRCPACRRELPSIGLDGSTAEREEHINECLESHFAASTSRRWSMQPLSSNESRNIVTSNSPGASSSQQVSASVPRPRAESGTGRDGIVRRRQAGGISYLASEKEVRSSDGELVECVICLEEFEIGDELTLLECFCKFHRACAADWQARKGFGACPIHQDGL